MLQQKPQAGAKVFALPRPGPGPCDGPPHESPRGENAPESLAPVLIPRSETPGPARRRVFTPEEKARIVAESFESGRSVCAVARKHGIVASQLFAWRKSARLQWERQQKEAPGEARAAAEPPAAGGGSAGSERDVLRDVLIEIAIGQAVVRVQKGADAATLKEVLRALREQPETG